MTLMKGGRFDAYEFSRCIGTYLSAKFELVKYISGSFQIVPTDISSSGLEGTL